MNVMTILVTGDSGFIGFHVCKRLLMEGHKVIGIDNLNSYYDRNLKLARQQILKNFSTKNNSEYIPINADLENSKKINKAFKSYKPEKVINLAAQAGVRYSLQNPSAYIQTNIVGFGNIIEACREFKVRQLIYASSSSVYGGNKLMPFSEKNGVDHPVSIYAASKRTNELIAHSYSHLYQLPTTGLRFFTVYGPWGRPDMALFLFTKAILEGKPINIFNNGEMTRDFTYIDDITESIIRLLEKPAQRDKDFNCFSPNPSLSWAPFKIFNIGNSSPTHLMDYINELENALGKEAKKNFLPMQPGDVQSTSADTSALEKYINFKPKTSIKYGISEFTNWYKDFYKIHN